MSMAALTLASDRLAAAASSFEGAHARHIALEANLQAGFTARQNTMRVGVFVNQVSGSDTANGTEAAPLRSITAALARTPVGGACYVTLLSDYTISPASDLLASDRIPVHSGKRLELRCSPSGPRLTVTGALVAGASFRSMHGFWLEEGAHFSSHRVRLVLPSAGAQAALAPNSRADLVLAGPWYHGAPTSISLLDVEIARPANPLGAFASAGARPFSLDALAVIASDQPLAGFWLSEAAAGTASASLPWLLTNLSSL